MTKASFGFWFAGLVDGEGSFTLHLDSKRRFIPQPRFDLTMRADDLAMLEAIREELGYGLVNVRKTSYTNPQGYHSKRMAAFIVWKKSDCLKLVELLEKYPLRSKKARDFRLWAEAVRLWNSNQTRGRWNLTEPRLAAAVDRMRELYQDIRDVRKYAFSDD